MAHKILGMLVLISSFCFAQSELAFTIINLEPVNCDDSNTAKVTLFVAGGQPPYSFEMVGNNSHNKNSPIFSGISSGTYTFKVTDAVKATILTTILVGPTGPSHIEIQFSYPCDNDDNGLLFVTVQSSDLVTATLTYPDGTSVQKTDLDGNFEFQNIEQGDYTLELSDDSCPTSSTFLFAIPNPEPITITSVVTTPQTSTTGGTITIETKGGAGDIFYQLNNETPTTNQPFKNLSAGDYTITAGVLRENDVLDCSVTQKVTVALSPGNETYMFIQKKYC